MTNLNMNNKINFLQANSTTTANANAPPRTEGGELPKIIGDGGFSARFGNLTSGSPRKELSPETEAAALKLFDEIYAELIDDRKQPPNEIIREVTSWLPPDYGLSSAD